MSFLYNNVPIIPGAYLVNGVYTSANAIWQIPIFSSVPTLVGMAYENRDNMYYVLPGYKIEIYNSINYISSLGTIDNTNGTKILYKDAPTADRAESIKMFYKGVEIPNKYTYTPYASVSGTPPATGATSTNTIGAYQSFGVSLFPGAYLINLGGGTMPIFFSISDLPTFLDLTGDREDGVLVMPGYKIILYFDGGFTGNYVAIDNTIGTTIIVGQSNQTGTGGWDNDRISSCKLFFNGNEITQTNFVSA
jgi:hypothetical protein